MKKVLSLTLAVLMVLSLLPMTAVAAGSQYDDVGEHWAESSIERWSEYKIVEGDKGHFRPNDSLTRGEMAKILANILGLTDEGAENPFADVAEGAWYAPFVLRCYVAGIIKGDGVNANPTDFITRQEAMVMICRALNIADTETPDLSAYRDNADVADWAKGYVATMTASGIVNGVDDDLLAPLADIDRAAIMVILDRSVVQYINTPGSYTLHEKGGIIVIAAAGDVTLTGKTAADILVTPAAAGKTLAFDKAEVAGAVTVQADGMKVTNKDSKLPEIAAMGEGITVEEVKAPEEEEDSTPSGGGGGGGGGGYTPVTPPATPSVKLSVTATGEGGKLAVGDVITAIASNADGLTIVWNVGGFDLESTEATYTVATGDMGKTIFAKLVREDGTQAAKSTGYTVVSSTEVDVASNEAPVQIDLKDQNTTILKEVIHDDGSVTKEEVTVSENDKLVLSIEEKTVTAEEKKTAKSAVKNDVENSVLEVAKAATGSTLTLSEDEKTELASSTEIKAVDVDLTLVTTTTTDPDEGEGEATTTTTETPVHPVGNTRVTLSAAQMGMAGEDLRLYHFIASHTNVNGVEQVVDGKVDEKGETVTFTTNGLSTIWIGNVPPRTVTFDTGGGTKVESQRVRFGSTVNTTILPEIEKEGFLFCGWNYDLSKTPVVSNMTVTAKWVQGTMMPASQYEVTLSAEMTGAKNIKEDGEYTIAADPDARFGENISATVSVTPYATATKYYVSSDAVTAAAMTDFSKFTAVNGTVNLTPVAVTDASGALKPGKTSYFIKWISDTDPILALQELTVVVDNGATDTKVVTRDINRGVGTFEPYMTSSTKPEATRWVGYVNGNPMRGYYNGEEDYYLHMNFNFGYKDFQWPEEVTYNDYDVLHVDFTPFSGESYSGKTITAECEQYVGGEQKSVTVEHEVTSDGKLALTLPVSKLSAPEDVQDINIALTVTVDNVTQSIGAWFANPNYKEPERSSASVSSMDDLRAELAKATEEKAITIEYIGTEDVTLTDALTIPYNAYVRFETCNFTVGNGGTLTIESATNNAAYFVVLKGSFTVADGGKVVATDTRASDSTTWNTSLIRAKEVEMQSGSALEVRMGGGFSFASEGGNGISCILQKGSTVSINDASFGIEGYDKAFANGQINMTGGYVDFVNNDTNEIDGSITLNNNGKWSYIDIYGDTTITSNGSITVNGNNAGSWSNARLSVRGPLTNRGTITLSGMSYGLFYNTGYSQYNEGTISVDSNAYISCEGTKLMNTGSIIGSGMVFMNLSEDMTDYDTNHTGIEYVDEGVAYEDCTPERYPRYKFTGEPAATIQVTLYKGMLINENNGTCTLQTYTEDFPAE